MLTRDVMRRTWLSVVITVLMTLTVAMETAAAVAGPTVYLMFDVI